MTKPSVSIELFRKGVILPLCAIAAAAPALSAPPSPPEPPPFSGTTGIATFEESFSDTGNETAKAVAALEGISVGEATRRLRLQNNAARLARKLEERFPDEFAGAEFNPSGGSKVVIYRKAGAASLLARGGAVETDLQGGTSEVEVPLSRGQIRKVGSDLARSLAGLGIPADVAVSAPRNEIRVLARDPAQVRSAVEGGRLTLPDIATVEQFDGIQTTATVAGSMAFNSSEDSCTTGFVTIRASDGTKGISTAGHCGNTAKISNTYSTTYNSSGQSTFSYRNQWITPTNTDYGIDFQWGTANVTSAELPPIFYNGSSWVTVTGAQDDLGGTYVCKYGRTTGLSCGIVDAYEYYDSAFRGYFPRVNRPSGSPILNDFGDSGAPVFAGSLAVGLVHGKDASGNMYYTPLRNLVQNSVDAKILYGGP